MRTAEEGNIILLQGQNIEQCIFERVEGTALKLFYTVYVRPCLLPHKSDGWLSHEYDGK
jgi:hypothetical protein